MSTTLHQTLAHRSLHPHNLGILPGKKSWLLSLDIIVLSDAGNIFDALFMAARAALWDTKVPRTKSVQYKARKIGGKLGGDMDVDEETTSGFDTRNITRATDFELPDYWDEGEVLVGRDLWPVCVTLNLVGRFLYRTSAMMVDEFADPSCPLSRCVAARRGSHASALSAHLLFSSFVASKLASNENAGPRRAQYGAIERFREGVLHVSWSASFSSNLNLKMFRRAKNTQGRYLLPSTRNLKKRTRDGIRRLETGLQASDDAVSHILGYNWLKMVQFH